MWPPWCNCWLRKSSDGRGGRSQWSCCCSKLWRRIRCGDRNLRGSRIDPIFVWSFSWCSITKSECLSCCWWKWGASWCVWFRVRWTKIKIKWIYELQKLIEASENVISRKEDGWDISYLESEHPEDEDVVRYPSSAEEDPSPSLSLAWSGFTNAFGLTIS